MLEVATQLLNAGLSVIPIKTDGSKAPSLTKWAPFQKRRADLRTARVWWSYRVGIAVIGGTVSGNLEILDFDRPGLYDTFATFADDNGLGELVQRLPLAQTPSDGRHCYYRTEHPVSGNLKLARDAEGKTLIEMRGEGGYAVIPPSPAECHPSGRPYVMCRGDLTALPVLDAGEVQALHQLARACNEYEDSQKHAPQPQPRRTSRNLSAGLRPGDDYNERGPVLELLQRHGWKVWKRSDGYELTRPGKSDGKSATFDKPAAPGLLYVFTSNAIPFQSDRGYTPFTVYALLEHGGDFAAAAKALAAEGYGDPVRPDPPTVDLQWHQPAQEQDGSDVATIPSELQVGVVPSIIEVLRGLPARVGRVGIEVSPDATLDERQEMLWRLCALNSQANTSLKFALGDVWNSFPGDYGAHKERLAAMFGPDTGLYQMVKSCGWVASQWPMSSRRAEITEWSFYLETSDQTFTHAERADFGSRWINRRASRGNSLTIKKLREEKAKRKGRCQQDEAERLRQWVARIKALEAEHGAAYVDSLLGVGSDHGIARNGSDLKKGVDSKSLLTSASHGSDVASILDNHPPENYPSLILEATPEQIEEARTVAQKRKAAHDGRRKAGEDRGSDHANLSADYWGVLAELMIGARLRSEELPHTMAPLFAERVDDAPDLQLFGQQFDIKAAPPDSSYLYINDGKHQRHKGISAGYLAVLFDTPTMARVCFVPHKDADRWERRTRLGRENAAYRSTRRADLSLISTLGDLHFLTEQPAETRTSEAGLAALYA